MSAEGVAGCHAPTDRRQLTAAQERKLAAVLDVIATDPHAPTTIRDRALADQLHVGDSLAALALAEVSTAADLADIGSGVGFPGIALAIALPHARLRLVDSQRRRCEFLSRICAAAGVSNAAVVCARAEEWVDGRDANDVVLARALAPQPVVLEYAAPLLRVGGRLVDWRGRREEDEEQRAARAAVELAMRPVGVHRVRPVEAAQERHLHVFEKVDETPARFPRRAGLARKRPLGA